MGSGSFVFLEFNTSVWVSVYWLLLCLAPPSGEKEFSIWFIYMTIMIILFVLKFSLVKIVY